MRAALYARVSSEEQATEGKVMKKLFILLCCLLIIVISLVTGCAPVPAPKGPNVPPHLKLIGPPEDTVMLGEAVVCVNFNFQAGAGLGDNPQERIHFYIDGQEITDLSWTMRGNPPSDGGFCYPREGVHIFTVGEHTLQIRYSDMAGEEFFYIWHYTARQEPIPNDYSS